MKRLSWKYIAGLIDADGCIDMQLTKDKNTGLYKYVRPRLRIGVSHLGKCEVIECLQNSNGGTVYVSNKPESANHNPNWRPHHTWTLEGKRLRPFLQNIAGHMMIKKEQALLAIFVIDNVMGKHVDDSLRQLLRSEFKAMKSDPQRLSEEAAIRIKSLML